MHEQRQQLDEWIPAALAALRTAGGWLMKSRGAAAAKKAGKWAIGGSKSARVTRGVANVAGIASMMGGGGAGGAGGDGGGDDNEGGKFDPGAYRDAAAGGSKKQGSLLDPRTVGYDADGEDGGDGKPGTGAARPDQMGAYGRSNREKKFMKTQSESWLSKIASVAKGVGGKAVGAATGKYGRGVQAATIGGAVAGTGALLAKRARRRKSASQQMYGGSANPNPYAKRTITSRLGFGTASESVDEGIIGTALKGAAVGAAGYGAYKGIKALRNPETRAKIGRAARSAGGVIAKHWAAAKSGGNSSSSGSESPMRKKVVNTAGRVGSALARQ